MPQRPVPKIAGFLIALGLYGFSNSSYAAYSQVGFQWVTPSEAPVIQGAPSSAPMVNYGSAPSSGTVSSGGPEIISPVIIEGQPSGVINSLPSSGPNPSSTSNISRSTTVPVISDNAVASSMHAVPSSTTAGSEIISSAPVVTPQHHTESSTSVSTMAPVSAQTSMAPAASSLTNPSIAMSSDVVQGFAKQVPLAVALRQVLPPGYGFSVDQNIDLGTLVSFQGGQPWRETLRSALEPVGLVMREQGQMVTIARADQKSSFVALKEPASASTSAPDAQAKPISVASIPAHAVQMSGTTEPVTMPAGEIGAGPVIQSWSAERGDTLHKILEEWSRRANIEFDWISEYDYPLQASVSFPGTFEDAVRNLLMGFEGAHPQPVAELHANSNLGQMVLVISTRGNNYSN